MVFLGDEEMATITRTGVLFTDFFGRPVSKTTQRVLWDPIMAEKAGYKHFMLKEIFEQPNAARETILGRVSQDSGKVFLEPMNITEAQLAAVERVTILACGTSWHAALVGKFLIEQLARVPVEVDYGSEYRYRNPIVPANTLAVVITQSGETADTLAALREAKRHGASSIAICNVVGSMATREANGTVYTHAGPEIGVASTKAFTSQLVALYLLGAPPRPGSRRVERRGVEAARRRAAAAAASPRADAEDRAGARRDRRALSQARGFSLPRPRHQLSDRPRRRAKLKEISYIHAEGYPAGEMKHGPIALIDEQMPVVAIAPRDHVFEKMIGNMQEVKARGGCVDRRHLARRRQARRHPRPFTGFHHPGAAERSDLLTPILMVVPLQLLAYDIAVRRGCDVDQPRNLAKTVTVE